MKSVLGYLREDIANFAKRHELTARHLRSAARFLLFALIFCAGIAVILKSDEWPLGSYASMHIAGSLLAIFGGAGVLLELYRKR